MIIIADGAGLAEYRYHSIPPPSPEEGNSQIRQDGTGTPSGVLLRVAWLVEIFSAVCFWWRWRGGFTIIRHAGKWRFPLFGFGLMLSIEIRVPI